jgi:hypothetical protein
MAQRGRPKKKDSVQKDDNYINKKLSNISNLQDEINSMLTEMDNLPKELTPPKDLLPGLDFEYIKHDYDKDIEIIKEEAKETLECVSSLYLNDDLMKKKNVKSIIKNDAEQISDIKFSLSCAKLGLVNCMKQLDAGANDPENHIAVNAYQKEIRDSSKMINDLLTKMKGFYKELRDEYERKEINEQQKIEEQKLQNPLSNGMEKLEDGLVLFDQVRMNKIIEDFKKDPTLLDGKVFGTSATGSTGTTYTINNL